ncbi:polyketide cyclase, partial [Mesorhizobium sp. M7A.T.Ca.TU.009.01.3.2]
SQGWPAVLSSLKSFLETGSGIDIFAKPKWA